MKDSKPKAGDIVRVQKFHYFSDAVYFKEFELVEFQHCLGFYDGDGHKVPCNFTPLSECYDAHPEAEDDYISNYGAVKTKYIQTFEIIKSA